MGSISDALRRAEQERQRMRGEPPAAPEPSGVPAPDAPAAAPEAPAEPSLASVVLKKAAEKPASDNTARPTVPSVAPAGAPAAPTATPLSVAIRQAPPPPAARKQQQVAETIVEDYESKRRLHLPASTVVYHERSGAVAEQYRKIRQGLMMANPRREPTMLVVTSSIAGEGKTVTVLNLGLSLVEIHANRVLLIDGDLHQGQLSRQLKLGSEQGLSELIASDADPASMIRPTPWHNLFVLPSGALSPPAGAAELLKLPSASKALRRLRGMFDWVLVDAPPARDYPDAGVLGASSDGILVAVALHHTRQDVVQQTIRRLQSMNLPVRGCILTRAG